NRTSRMAFYAPVPGSRPDQPASPQAAVHRPVIACDIAGFGRTDPGLHLHLRGALYRLAQDAYAAAGLDWAACHQEDRGDGILLIPPATVPAEPLLDGFAAHLRAGIRRYNHTSSAAAQIRLRLVIDAGWVQLDTHGASGPALIHAHRLL